MSTNRWPLYTSAADFVEVRPGVYVGINQRRSGMTPQAFRDWFTGFASAIAEAPNAQQWESLKAKVAEMDPGALGSITMGEQSLSINCETGEVTQAAPGNKPLTQADAAWARRREGW